MNKLMKKMSAAAVMLALAMSPALADTIDIKMLNKGEAGTMVFEPSLVQVNPGDTVTFVAADKGHNAETIKGLIPDGAEPFKGKTSQDISVTFDIPGIYAVKCMPHLGMGMVALVVVGGDTSNLDAIEDAKLPKPARKRIDAMIGQLSL